MPPSADRAVRCAAAGAIAAWAVVAAAAGAEPAPPVSARLEAPHAAYLELLGKGGAYGVGYDWAFADRLAVGGAVSFLVVDGERVLTLAPYLNLYPWAGRRSALVAQVGAEFVRIDVPSRIAGYPGTSATGIGGTVSAGYELRGPFLLRFLLTGVVGKGGFRPWAGLALGGAFRW